MIGLIIRIAVILVMFSATVFAFVEELNPNGGTIPCHAMGAILRNYIAPGGPSAVVLGSIIEREWVPGGWTAQDNTDNSNLLALIDAAAADEKERIVQRVEDYCILWEEGVDELDTPVEYRSRVGIAP